MEDGGGLDEKKKKCDSDPPSPQKKSTGWEILRKTLWSQKKGLKAITDSDWERYKKREQYTAYLNELKDCEPQKRKSR